MAMTLLHTDPIAPVIFWVTLFFLLAMVGRYFARYFGEPGVIGELLIGVLFGNISYFLGVQLIIVLREGPVIYEITKFLLQGEGLSQAIAHTHVSTHTANQLYAALSSQEGIDDLKVGYILDIFSRYGVIFLLFLVGVESSLSELKNTGKEALRVAFIGVIVPSLLGIAVGYMMLPGHSFASHLFVGATLCATSVGVTARVLKELNQLRTREARTILGAAMIDDLLGLFLLAVITGVVTTGHVDVNQMLQIAVATFLFFVITLVMGPWLLRKTILTVSYFEPWEAKLIASFMLVMTFAWIATLLNLAAIIGAFTAGLIIHDAYFETDKQNPSKSIHDLVSPLETILAPLFFMLVGVQVKLETFLDIHVLLLSSAFVIVAILGKLVSGLGAARKDDRLLIGMGMIPRGEVGLVFASIGKTLGVISDQVFSALVLMVILTTIVTPFFMKRRMVNT
jgi:Kef-type K+ transport system membrane component KefB